MILSEPEITREIILSSDRYINMCALEIPADQISDGGMENNNLGFHFGDAQTVAQPGRYNSNQIGRCMMRSVTWTSMGLALAFFTNGCAMHNFSMHDPIKDARMTTASVHNDKVVVTEMACEGPSTVCEVP
jgi:hypothetical protein